MEEIKGLHLGENGIGEDEDLMFCKQLGVEYIHSELSAVSGTPKLGPQRMPRGGGMALTEEGYYDAGSLCQLREHVESFGLKLGLIRLTTHSTWSPKDATALGKGERDRNIENMCKSIEAISKAGIPIASWGFGVLGVLRSFGWTEGRGGVRYKYFDYNDVKNDPPYPYGPISAEESWERIEYVVKQVVPVAEEFKVKLACHPMDVPTPLGKPYRGVVPVLNNVEGLKHFIDIYPSPYNGLCFCQGCISETSTSPKQVYDAIRYFGERKKIFWVHFRNIRGGLGRFEEVFPDEGSIDMLKCIRLYKETGCDCIITPDHAPQSILDTRWNLRGGHRARAFCMGYIRALIQMVESEN